MSHLCRGPVCPAAWHSASWNWNWMMKLMKYLEWRGSVGEMPRAQEKHSPGRGEGLVHCQRGPAFRQSQGTEWSRMQPGCRHLSSSQMCV